MTDDPLVLMIETLSKAARADIGTCMETAFIPEIDEAPDLKPLKCSLARELDTGRLSGKRALTMVIRSEGPRTRYGWTSTVSLKEVIDLAGRSLAFDRDGRLERKRAIIFSIWPLRASGVDADLFLHYPLDTIEVEDRFVPYHVISTTILCDLIATSLRIFCLPYSVM